MNKVQIFDGLKVKEDSGRVMFDAETVAIGIGIVESDGKYVRWQRVNKYLGKNSPQVEKIKKGDFITEQQLYKLAIKAESKQAERFQGWVTSEVLPSIRKNGGYQMKQQSLGINALKNIVVEFDKHDERIGSLEEKVTDIAENEEIRSWERKTLLEVRRNKVNSYLHGINDEKAYKSTRSKLYHAISSSFKRQFNLPGYDALPRKMYPSGLDFLQNWTPDDWTKAAIVGMEMGNKNQSELNVGEMQCQKLI